VASRFPTRQEYAGGDDDEWEPAPGRDEPGTPRKQRKLTRKSRLKPNPAKKRRRDDSGRVPHAEWKVMRERCFTRARYLCERCGISAEAAMGFDPHHRKLLSRGGRDELSNLAALCRACHDWCHANPRLAQGGGWIVPSGADPAVRAVTLWDGRMVQMGQDGSYVELGRRSA